MRLRRRIWASSEKLSMSGRLASTAFRARFSPLPAPDPMPSFNDGRKACAGSRRLVDDQTDILRMEQRQGRTAGRRAVVLHDVLAGAVAAARRLHRRSRVRARSGAREACSASSPDWSAPTPRRLIQSAVAKASNHKGGVLGTIVGVVILLAGATGVVIELQDALDTVWKVEPKPNRGIWGVVRTRLLSVAMILSLGFLLLVSLVVSAVLAALSGWLHSALRRRRRRELGDRRGGRARA